MTVKDLIWHLQQIYNQDKRVYFGTDRENEKNIVKVLEREFGIYLTD